MKSTVLAESPSVQGLFIPISSLWWTWKFSQVPYLINSNLIYLSRFILFTSTADESHRMLLLFLQFLQDSFCFSDVHRRESGRFGSLSFILKYFLSNLFLYIVRICVSWFCNVLKNFTWKNTKLCSRSAIWFLTDFSSLSLNKWKEREN